MRDNSHKERADFIWKVCDLLRGHYKRNEYRKVILPLVVIRRFDCVLQPTKDAVLEEYETLKGKSENVILTKLQMISGLPFYNVSKLTLSKVLDDPNQLAQNLLSYISGFSPNIRGIIDRFRFDEQIERMNEKDILYRIILTFISDKLDFSPSKVANEDMGYIFEELIRIGAEQANEEAGEHFTPREVIKLMVYILLSPQNRMNLSGKIKKFYDPACGTGGMLSMAEEYIKEFVDDAEPHLYGQDMNDEAWAICYSDMLIKGNKNTHIVLGDTFRKDGFKEEKFDYMLANPPFGVSWEQQKKVILNEAEALGFDGRFGAGTPRINDGSFLFLQHMISKMYKPEENGGDGSRIAIVFNGSPLFNGDAGSGESEIRRWIIENDWLETIVALPNQLFYNTGISTYLWILSNKKEAHRKGKIQLIDAREFWRKQTPSLNNKRKYIPNGDGKSPNDYISTITDIYDKFENNMVYTSVNDDATKTGIVSKIFDNQYFGYYKLTIERPLRLNFCASEERIAKLDDETGYKALAVSKKKNAKERFAEEATGVLRQEAIKAFLCEFGKLTKEKLYIDRKGFLVDMRSLDKKVGIKLNTAELKAILSALSERDELANPCTMPSGNIEPDSELRDYEKVAIKDKIGGYSTIMDTEQVSILENIDDYFAREVVPYVGDAWVDKKKTKIGYEIPLTREFYVYQPPRDLKLIDNEIKALEREIAELL